MRLAAASRVLNESDIIEAFVRHTAHFVDHHIFVDNGSVDGTLRILENLKDEGFGITVFQSHARSFVESKINTFLYQTAVTGLQADWVIFLDTDEFIDDRELRQAALRDCIANFAATHGEPACIEVPLREYHITPDDPRDIVVANRITHCSPTSDNTKVIVRGDLIKRQAVIQPGSHAVLIDNAMTCPVVREPSLTYAHYAVRSPYQWLSKSIIGWAKILAAGHETISAGYSYHYKEPFEILRTEPQAILRNPRMMQTPTTAAELIQSPITYRGGPLKYTADTDYQMRAVQVMMQYLHELATQHGEMLVLAKKLSDLIGHNESGVVRIL
ncbi:MAG: glycosyltransferase family 2 protein [Steroidobacteraceae bacterium]|jgi:glycosyltransferase involved in cell wall biosynthesis